MENFPGNSKNPTGGEPRSSKPPKEEKVVVKVVTTEVVKRPKSLGHRFKTIFFGGDVKEAMRYIAMDVLLPAFRNMVIDATSKGVERVVNGDAPRRRYEMGRPRVSYNNPVDRYARQQRGMLPDQPPHAPPRRRQDVEEVILVSREEAELVIERMTDIIDKYEVVSIADLMDLVGMPSTYVDNNWGWTSLNYANVRQIREGYLIDLPPVEPLK